MKETQQQEKTVSVPSASDTDGGVLMWLGVVGLMVGIGQLLASDEVLTWRVVIGRALISSGLGMSATVIFLWFPETPFFVLMGVASAIVSLGTSGMERAFQLVFKKP